MIKSSFLGLGNSRSRLRLSDDSSEDELDKIIKQRQKKLQRRELRFIVNCTSMIKYGFYLLGYNRSNSRTLTSDSDSAAAGNILFSSHIKDRI